MAFHFIDRRNVSRNGARMEQMGRKVHHDRKEMAPGKKWRQGNPGAKSSSTGQKNGAREEGEKMAPGRSEMREKEG